MKITAILTEFVVSINNHRRLDGLEVADIMTEVGFNIINAEIDLSLERAEGRVRRYLEQIRYELKRAYEFSLT